MLSRWVSQSGARVLQIEGTTRDLYYYPKDTVAVICMGEKQNNGGYKPFVHQYSSETHRSCQSAWKHKPLIRFVVICPQG